MKSDPEKKFILVGCNEIGFYRMRKIFASIGRVEKSAHDPLNDEASLIVEVKGIVIHVESIFSDYLINFPENCPDETFDLVLQALQSRKKSVLQYFLSKIRGT